MKKGTKLYSILHQKCPRCHEGDLFEKRNPYVLSKLWVMHDKCSNCGQHYQLEPSFFYGAMYVNYALTVAIAVAVFTAMYVLGGKLELAFYIIGIVSAIFLLAPITFRIGRMIWINMFIGYKPEWNANQNIEDKKSH